MKIMGYRPLRDGILTRSPAHPLIFCLAMLSLLTGFTQIQRPLDQRLAAIVAQADAPLASLAVVAIQGGEINFEGYWGYRRMDADDPLAGLPVTADTRFRVASLSKVATALGAMLLVEQGKLQLDRDISAYLGYRLRNPNYPDRPITARMLLSHTSSLRDGSLYILPPPYTLRDFFDPAGADYSGGAHFASAQGSADHGPGGYFTYANLNYGVLATIIEAVSGERFDQYMQRHLFAPLDIKGGYTLDSLTFPDLAQVATLYTKQNPQGVWDADGPWYAQYDDVSGAPPPAPIAAPRLAPAAPSAQTSSAHPLRDYRIGENATIFAPYAGLRISARDLAKLVLLFLDEGRYNGQQIVAPATLDRMLREQWHFDPEHDNGSTQGGFYNAWGLGLQHSSAVRGTLTAQAGQAGESEKGDCLTPDCAAFWGHRGEAYGFLGNLWFDPQRRIGFVYLIGGLGDDPLRHPGSYSLFSQWEEAIQSAVLEEIGVEEDNDAPSFR